ncbi:hypothetical protein PHK61_25265 [Actinomycetospora lutea]|uniref:hypothetical protein n=1 Tax=Actinomycetospora lutea TaxID=663604 RepID=UPI002366AD03|nr:hypothetical protein [Actinomycetospora lutea]MDD7941734.1 hypothetical protein [Actinomycetospora lutea]
MAERDMTGEDRPELERRRAEDPPRIGRFGFGEIGELGELDGLAGGRGDLANLPPWSVRDERAGAERPDRDPVALAAWRRVAERRRQRAAAVAPELAGPVDEPGGGEADPAPDPAAVPEAPKSQRLLAEQALAALERAAREDQAPDDEPIAAAPAPEEPDEPDEPEAPDEPEVPDGAAEPAEDAPEPPVASEDPSDEGLEPWLGSGPVDAEARDDRTGPPGRPGGPPGARGGHDPRPGGGPSEPGGRHEVLLSLAGRIDDDALTSVRELVAVEDEAAAAELLGGCLLAAGAGVTAREHAVLGRWFAASRVDPELVDALPRDPEADRRDEHRFTADPPSGAAAAGGAGEAVARAAARLPGVQRVHQCWRTTPAGTAPGPVPHRVVLVETRSADDCEHVAHHVAHAARGHGAVSVEVFAAGAELPAYHRAAVRAARPLETGPPSGETTLVRPSGPSTRPAAPASSAFATGGSASPLRPRRPDPAPTWRRGAEEVPPFGAPAGEEVPPFGVATPTAPAGEPDDAVTGPAELTAPAELTELAESVEPVEEEYRTVAAAGRDPLERTAPPEERPGTVDAAEPEHLAEPAETLATPAAPAPPEPAPVDLDPEDTAERIAALWRVPPPDEILSDQHPISRWSDGPVGPTFGPAEDEPVTTAQERPASPRDAAPVDPDAATGDMPAVAPAPDAAHAGPAPHDAPAANGRVRRARHSRHETGELEVPADLTAPAAPTNGHRHGPGADGHDRSGEAATGPVTRPEQPAAPRPPEHPEPPEASAPRPPASSDPDSFDVQLSDRERELLARLHEELASRERLAPESPDPLLGRPPAAPPGSEDATAPRPRPNGPPPGPGRSGPWQGPPPGVAGTNGAGTNGHGPVNGHGLPRRADHDDEDGPPRDA